MMGSMLGWSGNVATLVGISLVAHKKRSGFLVGIVGGVFWGIQGTLTHQVDLVILEVVIAIVQAFSWWKWGKPDAGPVCRICSKPITR